VPTMIDRKCHCGAEFRARSADVARGWGKFCSKSCKAREQEARTGQNAAYERRLRSGGGGWGAVFDSSGQSATE